MGIHGFKVSPSKVLSAFLALVFMAALPVEARNKKNNAQQKQAKVQKRLGKKLRKQTKQLRRYQEQGVITADEAQAMKSRRKIAREAIQNVSGNKKNFKRSRRKAQQALIDTQGDLYVNRMNNSSNLSKRDTKRYRRSVRRDEKRQRRQELQNGAITSEENQILKGQQKKIKRLKRRIDNERYVNETQLERAKTRLRYQKAYRSQLLNWAKRPAKEHQ